ncbi:hepatocellular carcinoma-associated antigen 66 [Lepidopterella palustris CBS 459.81]|uniref:Hepatocellular carcinoma-associated antigen 66 n=1 Tax=Lepidopterella palustris CBS 459.81 TaxID=1314670 RepID=A0A8E2EI46_9PEZI|nr:hepatocellular carcinoma-associated antigen 66 [Lepidopterella palustris CBS 459.81]
MAGASDKARFYLEQSVPELQEFERKGIFSKEEITTITKKRSDFEHTLNSRGSRPSDYVRYAEFETNLEALRRKRVKRLGVKASGHNGQKRIFFILSRGTRKFHADIGLWMEYIEFARKEKAYKKLNDILTSVLRLHPAKPDLWIYAAHCSMDTQADMTSARSYMQRGLRFCKNSKLMWLEYAKLETIYIAKIAGRRKILGLDIDRTQKVGEDGPNSDMVALPEITAEDINPSLNKDDAVDEIALQNLAAAPVFTGAIPIAIFDAAMKQFQDETRFAGQFFDMFAQFDRLPCIQHILKHVVGYLNQVSPDSITTAICMFRSPLIGIESVSPQFASALGQSLDRLNTSLRKLSSLKADLSKSAIQWILPIILTEIDMDPSIKKVLLSSLRKFCRILDETKGTSQTNGDLLADFIRNLRENGQEKDATYLERIGSKQSSANEKTLQAQDALVR